MEAMKKILNKFWFLLWKDNTWKGWLFSVIFIFIFIKLIFFPSLSLITGTSLPLAIVESCSMYHEDNLLSDYNQWWDKHENKYNNFNIEKQVFKNFKMKNGFNKGDILFITGIKSEKVKIGDIIIFQANQKNPIIHRVVNIQEQNNELQFETIGDNNNGQLSFEKTIKPEQIVGKAVFKISPYIGWIKLIFFEYQRPNSEKGFCKEN